jgi:hypothetical protein
MDLVPAEPHCEPFMQLCKAVHDIGRWLSLASLADPNNSSISTIPSAGTKIAVTVGSLIGWKWVVWRLGEAMRGVPEGGGQASGNAGS